MADSRGITLRSEQLMEQAQNLTDEELCALIGQLGHQLSERIGPNDAITLLRGLIGRVAGFA